MDDKKKSCGVLLIIISVLCILALGYGAYNVLYLSDVDKTENNSADKKEETEIIDKSKLDYVRTTSDSFNYPGEISYDVYIEKGIVKYKGGYSYNGSKTYSSGIGNIKYVTSFNHVVAGCCGMSLAALSNSGELYIAEGLTEKEQIPNLKKVNYSKKIKELYITDEIEDGYRAPLYVLNEDNELLKVNSEEYDQNTSEYNITVGGMYENRQVYVGYFPYLFINIDMKTKEATNVKYNNKNVKPKYVIYYETEVNDTFQNNMLILTTENEIIKYKSGASDDDLSIHQLTFSKYNSKKVKSVVSKREDTSDDEITNNGDAVITYQDGKTETIKNAWLYEIK